MPDCPLHCLNCGENLNSDGVCDPCELAYKRAGDSGLAARAIEAARKLKERDHRLYLSKMRVKEVMLSKHNCKPHPGSIVADQGSEPPQEIGTCEVCNALMYREAHWTPWQLHDDFEGVEETTLESRRIRYEPDFREVCEFAYVHKLPLETADEGIAATLRWMKTAKGLLAPNAGLFSPPVCPHCSGEIGETVEAIAHDTGDGLHLAWECSCGFEEEIPWPFRSETATPSDCQAVGFKVV